MTALFSTQTGRINFAKLFLGLSVSLMGIALMYTMWFTNLPKPLSGDGFMNAVYIKALLWVFAGMFIPFISTASNRKSVIIGLCLIATELLLLYSHSQMTLA